MLTCKGTVVNDNQLMYRARQVRLRGLQPQGALLSQGAGTQGAAQHP